MSTTPDQKKYAVLYVDDEERSLKYFRKGLEKEFTVLTAANPAEAMVILEKQAADIGVVISDQVMPGSTGVEMLTRIRERWPAIVRILTTAFTDIDSAVAAVNAGAVFKYLTKPTDFPLLKQALNEALNMHRQTLYRDALAETLKALEEQRRATQASEAQREQLQQRLIAVSREAGRAEVATGILHNVGNVLNSMNVSAGVVSESLAQSRIGNLCKALAMFEEHSKDLASFLTTDERGKVLPGYLSKLAGVLAEEQQLIVNEVAALGRNIDHIGQIVQMQQSHAKEIVMREEAKPAELMESAIHVNRPSLEKHEVKVVREFGEVPSLMLDTHRVLQILINLVNNANNAVKESDVADKQITLTIEHVTTETPARVRFSVIDNGVGIAAENLTKIFVYGFTTRKEGHGFGLHSAANAAREMGGLLTVASDGVNKGARFTLELPMDLQNIRLPDQSAPAVEVAA